LIWGDNGTDIWEDDKFEQSCDYRSFWTRYNELYEVFMEKKREEMHNKIMHICDECARLAEKYQVKESDFWYDHFAY
jgi:ribulose 1,5-bisphosphate carboxylase large subunit-like protein